MSFQLPSAFSHQDLGAASFTDRNDDGLEDMRMGSDRDDEYEGDSGSESGGSDGMISDEDDFDQPIGTLDQDATSTNQNTNTQYSLLKRRKRKLRKIMEKRDQLHRNKIIEKLTPEQYDRFEMYKRSSFKPVIKRLIANSTSAPANKTVEIIVAGIAKVFVGELVEASKLIQKEWGDDPRAPIEPKHLREAYRRYREHQNKKKKYAFR